MGAGLIIGIIIAVIVLIIILVIGVSVFRKRHRQSAFDKFDNKVKFSKNNGYTTGAASTDNVTQEMDDTATAIKKGNKLYV